MKKAPGSPNKDFTVKELLGKCAYQPKGQKAPDQLSLLHDERMGGLKDDIYPKEYHEALDKLISTDKEIMGIFPKDKAYLMDDLSSAHDSLLSVIEETAYRLGFCDAFRLAAVVFAEKP